MINALSAATHFSDNAVPNQDDLLNRLLGSQIFILSDFYRIDDLTRKFASRLIRHNDLMFCHIVDQLESQPPEPGRYRFTDGENSCAVSLLNQQGRQQYRNVFADKEKNLQELSQSLMAPLITMSATDSFSSAFSVDVNTRAKRAGSRLR